MRDGRRAGALAVGSSAPRQTRSTSARNSLKRAVVLITRLAWRVRSASESALVFAPRSARAPSRGRARRARSRARARQSRPDLVAHRHPVGFDQNRRLDHDRPGFAARANFADRLAQRLEGRRPHDIGQCFQLFRMGKNDRTAAFFDRSRRRRQEYRGRTPRPLCRTRVRSVRRSSARPCPRRGSARRVPTIFSRPCSCPIRFRPSVRLSASDSSGPLVFRHATCPQRLRSTLAYRIDD